MNNDYIQDYLMHHGIKGQKWGVRRFTNDDGSLTEEGKKRYYDALKKNGKSRLEKALINLGNKESNKNVTISENKINRMLENCKNIDDSFKLLEKTYNDNDIINKELNKALKEKNEEITNIYKKYEYDIKSCGYITADCKQELRDSNYMKSKYDKETLEKASNIRNDIEKNVTNLVYNFPENEINKILEYKNEQDIKKLKDKLIDLDIGMLKISPMFLTDKQNEHIDTNLINKIINKKYPDGLNGYQASAYSFLNLIEGQIEECRKRLY